MMNYKQPELDLFSVPNERNDGFVIHKKESSPESEKILEANRKRLSRNCRFIFERMMNGEELTSYNCGLVDFRRRICDLKSNGVLLSNKIYTKEDKEAGTFRCKIWYMDSEQKIFNKKFLL